MLFLFRSAPEDEKRIHSKFFRKFWRSRGTKEPAYITVEHTVNECGRAARGSCLSSACVDILKSFFELYIFGRQVCFTEWVVYNICAFATICSRSTSVFSTGPGSGKQGQAKELQKFVHLVLWQRKMPFNPSPMVLSCGNQSYSCGNALKFWCSNKIEDN